MTTAFADRKKPRIPPQATLAAVAFPSELGWMAVVAAEKRLLRLTFGHPSRAAAVAAMEVEAPTENAHSLPGDGIHLRGVDLFSGDLFSIDGSEPRIDPSTASLAERLQAFAAGHRDDFLDVDVADEPLTPFQRRVVHRCRRIPYGRTLSYGELAAQAGRPGAARAVGRVMSTNRFPLVVPCHRVLAANGRLGGYSAPSGLTMKRRLLALEAANDR
jgi:methylated-DNA-[protein]-cysteine S-methyltransferase